jgi:outer membrane receptor protein involved in Fe transport
MIKYLLVFKFLLLLGASSLYAAQTIVKGIASDSTSGAVINFANVSLHAAETATFLQGRLADSAGYFEFLNVAEGEYAIQISSLGYVTQSRRMEVKNGDTIIHLGIVALQQDAKLLNSVNIRGEKSAVQYRSDRIVLNIGGNGAFKSSANVIDILRKSPGVSVSPDGALLLSGRNTPVIFINGKPIEMSPDEMLAYLNGLTPESIEAIEIIANPSSKYDGQYKGIIDIRLKSDHTIGLKGSLNSAFRRNVYSSSDNGLSISYRTKGTTYNLRAAYVLGDDYYQYDALQRLASKNYMTTNTQTKTANNNPTLQFGADYALKKNRRLEFSVKTYQANRNLSAHNRLTFEDSLKQNIAGINLTENQSTPQQRNFAVNAGYNASFGNNIFTFFGSITSITNRQSEDIQIRDGLRNTLRSYWKTALQNQVLIRTIQGDYSKTLKKGQLESGAKYAYITTDNDLQYDTLGRDNTFVQDAGRSNQFLYREYIAAGYLMYNLKIKKYTFNLSVRAEHTRTVANSVTQNETQARSYLNWLPGANISYDISKASRIGVAFTRRLTRPNFDQLNPFRFYLSPLNYRVGNPYLRPSLISSFQTTFNHNDLNFTLTAGREKDLMARYPEYNRVTNELLYLGMNLPHSDFASLESGYALAITNWWRTSHNIGVYYQKQQMPYLGKTYAIGVFDYSINGSQTFSLPEGITADLTYRYKSRSGNSLYIIKPLSSVDLGVQKSWLGGKLSTKMNVYDIFYGHHISLVFREKSIIDNQLSHRFKTRRLVVALTYNFGSATYNARKARTSEEEGRAGN